MVAIEIPDNPNCAPAELRVFNDLEPPRPVRQVRLEREPRRGAWCDVTGWTLEGTPCPVWAQAVDDSGEGVAVLVYGGEAGLRLRPAEGDGPWRLDDRRQWGEPFLLIGDPSDLR